MWLGVLIGWFVTSALIAAAIARWFKYQEDMDERDA